VNIFEKLQMGNSYTSYISNKTESSADYGSILGSIPDSALVIIAVFWIVLLCKKYLKNASKKKLVEERKTEEFWLNSNHQSFKQKLRDLYEELGYEHSKLIGSKDAIVLKSEEGKSVLYCYTYERDFTEEDVEKLLKLAKRKKIEEISVFISEDITKKEKVLLKKSKIDILKLDDIIELAKTL
tara:strand:- start:149 stop:697 length:549 start_codon:yes stop_codon:yes gene_type:complete